MAAEMEQPGLCLKNGEPNPAWLSWYMTHATCNENKARYDWWERIRAMDEPPLMTDKEKPNPIWVTWWRAHKGCSKNVALNICRSKIAGDYIPNKKAHEWLNQRKTTRYLDGLR